MREYKILFKGTNVPVYAYLSDDNKSLLFKGTNVPVLIDEIDANGIKFKGTTAPKTKAEIVNVNPNYLTFTATGASTLKFKTNGTLTNPPVIKYSLNDGAWTDYTFGTDISLTDGQNVKFKGNNNHWNNTTSLSNYISFVASAGSVAASGSIMTLLDEQDISRTIPDEKFCFYALFEGCSRLTSAPELPAINLAFKCYTGMFHSCTGLTTAPALPATVLARACYYYMFEGCTGLTTAPALPATVLALSCYENMFKGCTGLTTAPALPAVKLVGWCYTAMFQGCTSLNSIPALSAAVLSDDCYKEMFKGCSLIKMSATETEEYVNAFTFGADPTDNATDMFTGTGGTFTGAPTTTTYYTSNTIVPAA